MLFKYSVNYKTTKNLIILFWQLKLQPRTKYLRQTLVFMGNSALREKFNFDFQGVFWRKTGH